MKQDAITERLENVGTLQMRLLPSDVTDDGPCSTSDADRANEHVEHAIIAKPSKQPGLDDLFFDMLFAAALSVYGNNVDLSQMHKVLIFVSYFSLLWWAWWTVTLFDVRYRGRDHSGFLLQCGQRILRCALLVVWVAFATITGEYSRGCYSNFATIYICSRVTLMADYLLIMVYTRYMPLQSCIQTPLTADEDEKDGQQTTTSSRTNTRIKRKRIFTIKQCHLLMCLGTFVSMLFWVISLFVETGEGDKTINPTVVCLWCTAIAIEMFTEVAVEVYGSQRELGETPMVERLALFSLIIFGNGFENIGQSLNYVRPGARDPSSNQVDAGGWSNATIVNAISSVFIVTLLFFGYFARAIREFVAHPARILLWSYMHVVLHVAAATLVIGLGKVISFINTLNALLRLSFTPEQFLPNSTDWKDYVENRLPASFARSIPNVADITDYYDRSFVSMIVATITVQGAQIPDVNVSTALVNSTFAFHNMSLPQAVSYQLGNYQQLIQSVQSPDTLAEYVEQNVFQFHYAYLCPALFFIADCCLKILQRSVGGFRSMDKYFIVSMSVRFFFAGILICVQVIYYRPGKDSFSSIINALVYMTIILLIESCLQVVLLFMQPGIQFFRSLLSHSRPA